MDRKAAIALLPPLHARALRLRDEGRAECEIAIQLGLDDDQVGPVLRVGEAKLAQLLADRGAR
jgi:hypothetical protein